MDRKLILFDLQVSQALQEQEMTRVELEPHDEPQTDESITEREVCVQEIPVPQHCRSPSRVQRRKPKTSQPMRN